MTVQSQQQKLTPTSLPLKARLPINRCNLPAVILGSLTFQQHPQPLYLDGVHELHKNLFITLDEIPTAEKRAEKFKDYMAVYFQINETGQATDNNWFIDYPRANANYLLMLRGWLFDSDQREGAIMKGWVESRFGLLPTWHKKRIYDADDPQYSVYLHERTSGIYNTNALDSQLDLLYSYCQFELSKQTPASSHITLYRGVDYAAVKALNLNDNIMLLNNINSFSSTRERADEFGDFTIEVQVPLAKIFFYSGLLPGILHGEDENIVIGGMYKVQICPF